MSEWLRRTGQGWKFKLGIAWILAGIVFLVFATVFGGAATFEWVLFALAFAAAGFAWSALAVRCPACRKRTVLWVMLHEPGHGWLLRMTTADSCPVCGDSSAAPPN